MAGDRKQWYEGDFYKSFIAPFLSEIRHQIKKMVTSGSNILDIGCGTGDLEILIAGKANQVYGIDISNKMIKTAIKMKEKSSFSNITFVNSDILDFMNNYKSKTQERFDHVIFSFCLHEMAPKMRDKVLSSVKPITEEIIIADFHKPEAANLWGIVNTIAESLSNLTHFTRYVDYVFTGGIESLISKNGYQIVEKKADSTRKFTIIRAIPIR